MIIPHKITSLKLVSIYFAKNELLIRKRKNKHHKITIQKAFPKNESQKGPHLTRNSLLLKSKIIIKQSYLEDLGLKK
jgi:hypothetical protein